jgi:putative IMPACT (imprinted ancient) family translation regulator
VNTYAFLCKVREATEYLGIEKETSAEWKDRGSRFYAFAYPVQDEAEIKSRLQALRVKFPDATHHCYAWVLGADRSRFRANDDGEPGHSAGTPILRQIHSFGLSHVLVVVVRYYGGVNLGVPGLIHAYGHATRLALETSSIVKRKLQKNAIFRFPFGEEGNAYLLVYKLSARVSAFDHEPEPVLYLQYDADREEELNELLANYPKIKVSEE